MTPHPSTTSSLGRVHDRGDAYTNIHRSHSSIELGSTDIPQSSDLDLFQNHLLDEPEDSILHEPSPHPGLPTFSQDVFGVLGEVLAASSSRPLFNGIHRSSTDTAVLNGLHQTHLAKGRSRDQAMVRPQKRPRSGSAHLSTGVQLGIQDSHLSTDPTAQTPLTRDAGLRQPGQHGLDRWTGHQLEDGLSQDVLRSGRVQKRVVTDDKEESGTSCRTFRVGSRSNDDSCIRAVSAFFGRVTGLRKSHPCLLRHQPQILPPRVILTNRRLGQWFDRIADITVPLQKSTRVIPRDLRSRTLLDKCVARKVPVARVVWLVRCMSPSELSDRHGGALSEDIVNPERRLEWIRGWTAAVQGLVDDQIKEENLAEHKSALVYSLELAAHFFAEGLVADDQHLDWVADRLGSTSRDTLLFWLAIARVHQASFSANVTRGNKLAASCALQVSELVKQMKDGPPNDLYTPLQSFIQDLLSSSPSCFILPTVWGAVRTVFERMSKPDAKSVKPVGSLRVIRANDRLAFWTVKDRLPHRPPSLEVVEILDATLYASSLDEPSTACLALVPDRFELTMSLIAWACSKSRASMAHIYTACRIFWTWAHQVRFNVRACLVEAAKVSEHYRGLCPLAVGRLLAELTRSGHFDMDTYLRSASANDAAPVHDNKREILMQAPFANLPVETQRRCMQLIPSIMGVGAMKDNIKGLQAKIAVSLKAVLAGHASELSSSKLHGMLDHLSARDRFDLGKWLRASLLPLLTGKMKDSEAVLPYNFVELVLLLLEQLDDFAQLRDVMSAVASKSDVESLHLVALCGEAHGDVLVSLGHYSKLRRAVLGRYRTLRASSTGPHRALCQLLLRGLNLAAFVVDDEQFLQREIDFCDPGIAAYTPLSDIDMDSAEDEMSDLDRLLANGPSLAEEQLLAALNMILNHVCQVKDATHTQIETITCNLQALRRANRDRFMPTLTSCVRAMSDNLDDAAMLRLGSILLLDDEMELDDLAACIDGVVAVAPDVGIADCSALLALRILTFFYGTKPEHGELPTSSDDAFEIWLRSPLIGWKRSVMAKQLECAHPHALIDLLVVGLGINTYGHADLRSLLMSPDLIGLVHRLLRNVDSGFLKEMHTLLRSASPTTSENLRELVAVVVDLPGHLQHLSHPMTADTVQSVLDHLFTTVGPNSLHPYMLCMSWVTSSSRHTTVSPTAISDICYRQCHEASSHEATLWHELMASIDPLVADDMRSHAEQAILFCPESNEALSKRLQARWSIAPTTHTSIFNTIKPNLQLDISPDKARLIARHLSIATKFCERDLADIPMFADWLQALLHLALIYHDSFKPGSILVSLLHTLCRLTTSTQLASRSDLISLPYDMACFFAPRADNASLAILRTHLADILDNERIRFLLGDQPLPPPASQVVSNISSLTPSPAFPTTTRTTTASSLAPSPATTSSTSRMTPAAPVEPISFGTRKWNSLSPPRLDKDLLDAAFRVWEKYREDS